MRFWLVSYSGFSVTLAGQLLWLVCYSVDDSGIKHCKDKSPRVWFLFCDDMVTTWNNFETILNNFISISYIQGDQKKVSKSKLL